MASTAACSAEPLVVSSNFVSWLSYCFILQTAAFGCSKACRVPARKRRSLSVGVVLSDSYERHIDQILLQSFLRLAGHRSRPAQFDVSWACKVHTNNRHIQVIAFALELKRGRNLWVAELFNSDAAIANTRLVLRQADVSRATSVAGSHSGAGFRTHGGKKIRTGKSPFSHSPHSQRCRRGGGVRAASFLIRFRA